MSRGNLFANIEDKFRSADKEKIFKVALASIRDFFDAFEAIEQLEDNYKFGTMVVGARIGVAGGGRLNSQEKELIDEIFGRVWKGSMEEVYEMVGANIRDDDYEMVKGITMSGNAVAMPYLYYILSFAYIDGKIEDGIAERLESLFSSNLLAGFFQSGMEEVTAQKIGLSGLEGEIVRWYKEDDKLRPLNEIQEHFSNRSIDEVQAALDSLVEKDILMCAETIVGKMYGFSLQGGEYYESPDDEGEDESPDEPEISKEDQRKAKVIEEGLAKLSEELEGIVDKAGIPVNTDETMSSNGSEPEINVDAIEEGLAKLSGGLKKIADEAGIDLNDGAIGETGFDMYNWSFKEGKTVRGDGWTVAIPDGFVQITSKDAEPLSGKKRLFELVPVTYKDEEDVDEIPIRILPGTVIEGVNSIGDYWMVHPEARAGVAGVAGVTAAEMVAPLMGQGGEIFSVGWEDVAAYIIVNETSDQAYSYQCSVLIVDKNYQLRIQTQLISDATKQCLNTSIMAWLNTMRFDRPNKACPTKTIFEEDECLSELLVGKTAKFEEAVEQAGREYISSVNGKIKMLEYMAENELLDEHAGETVRDILEKGMEVKLFFLEKADRVIEKLKQNNADAGLIETVIEKLTVLDDDCLDYDVDDEKIEIKVPKEVQAIRDKWKKLAPDACSDESKELRERKKDIEERKKIRAERDKGDITASEIASDIRRRMQILKDTFEDNAYEHKCMIESHAFDGPWDPAINEYISYFDDDMDELGIGTEELVREGLESLNEVYNRAKPKVVLTIVDAIEEAVEYVEGASINNDALDISIEYEWNNLDISAFYSEMRRVRSDLKKRQAFLDKAEKEQEEEDRRFEEAHKYGITKAEKEASLSNAKKDLMDLEGQKRKAEAELLNHSVKKDKAKADYNSVATECQNIQKEVQPKIDEIEKNVKILEAQISQENQRYKAGADERSTNLAGYQKKLKELTASYEVKEEVAAAYKVKAEKSSFSKKKMLAEYETKQTEIEFLRKRIDNIKSSMTDIEEEEKSERESHNKKVESCSSQKKELDQKKTQLKSDLSVRTNEFDKVKKCYEDEVLAEKTISKEIEEINKKISTVKNEISKIEEEIASSKA